MKRKIVSVIVITIIISAVIILYVSGIASQMFVSDINPIFLILIIGAALAIIGALIYTAIERIREIGEEDEDDISKY
ncbi:hypothetical protein RBU49_13770 [Clostridium sp. MB40-C1]|uniref:hypothetical protein n=1 Tax=Clostridium sp. MB40-C1 TaxID=3070996 RepID=UPI0027E1EB59|nr:hypothetical protein [Clostridium sp. MB40-C1]WMJ79924.1 hypothetical protein RBU49_13770 [Clostridium sp. MB40-C1]